MTVDRSGFELLLLHARLLPELVLARMAQDILDAPRDLAAGAGALPLAPESSTPAPGDAVDWFGADGLSDAELREIRAAGELELAAFDARSSAAATAPRPADAVAFEPAGRLDLSHELALAYAQRDAIAPLAAAALERVDPSRLEALLAGVAGAAAPLTETQGAEDLEVWLMLLQDDEPALEALLRYVRDAADFA